MFFRNLTLFRFTQETADDLARLDEVLADHRLRPCGPMEKFTVGFVPPIGRGDEAALTHAVQACTQFAVGGEDKLLPAAVINDELQRKVNAIAEEEGRPVRGRERKRIKEDLLTELLPRAFVRSSRTYAYVDTAHHWMVIDTASRKTAENVITQVREALGSFPALPMAPTESPRVLMTDWLANSTLPAGLALGDEVELRDPATSTGAIARCRRQDLDAEEILEHLRNGKQVFQLGLVFDNRMSFVLDEFLVVRKLKFLDVVLDELGDSHADAAAEADASFALLTLELQRLLAKFDEWFGLALDAPLTLHGQAAPVGMRKAEQAAKKLRDLAREDGATVTIEVGGKTVATFGSDSDSEALLQRARDLCISTRTASIARLQRELRIGYLRAARTIEQLEQAGVVSAPDVRGVRTVLLE